MSSASSLSRLTLLTTLFAGVFFLQLANAAASPLTRPLQDNSEWVNPSSSINQSFSAASNAFSDDARVAVRTGSNSTQRYAGYSFSIPTQAVIQGIELRVDAWRSRGSCPAMLNVGLSWDNETTYTTSINTGTLGTSDPQGALVLGGPNDNWGHAWTSSELNSGFTVRVQTTNLVAGCEISLDWLPARIYYTTDAPTTTYTPPPTDAPTQLTIPTETPVPPDTEIPTAALSETPTSETVPPSDTPTELPSQTPTETETAAPTATFTPADAETPFPTETRTLLPTEIPSEPPTPSVTASSTPPSSATPTATDAVPSPSPAALVISQIYGAGGNNGALWDHDYIELFNRDTVSVNLSGWSVQYGSATGSGWSGKTLLPDVTLAPGQYFLIQESVTGDNGSALPEPDASGTIALSATAGRVALVNSTLALMEQCPTNVVDFVGYGTSTLCHEGTANAPAPNAVKAVLRQSSGCQDTNNNAADFLTVEPNPRNRASSTIDCDALPLPTQTPAAAATPTGTATLTPTDAPTPTATFVPNLVINEVLSHPGTDWNGDSLINADDEWLELYNPNPFDADISGYQLDDVANGGTSPYTLPAQTTIQANGFLTLFKSVTNIGLNDSGDDARLLYPDGSLADATHFGVTGIDRAWARETDGGAEFTLACVPTLNAPNCSQGRYVTPTSTSTPEPTQTPTATSTSAATETPTPTFTPTDLPSPQPFAYSPLDVVINEVAWAGTVASATDEWLELYNNTNAPIDLTGWTLTDDGDISISLRGTIAAHDYFLLERTDDHTINDISADQIYTGGLNNNGEVLTLRDGALNVIDTANDEGGAWDAGVASARCSMERRNSELQDSSTNWATNDGITQNGHDADGEAICGTPREQNSASLPPQLTRTPTPTATPTPTNTPPSFAPLDVVINEVAWAGTEASANDEWMELFNNTNASIDLTGWTLTDGDDISIALGGTIAAHDYFLLERTDDSTISDLAADQIYTGNLNNAGETLVLYDAAANVIDRANGKGGAWSAGSASAHCSTERRNSEIEDISGNWTTNDGITRNGLDADGQTICGTPREPNAASLPPQPTRTRTLTSTSTPTNTPQAYSPLDLVISEVAWAGTEASANDEWIELFNNTGESIPLRGWTLIDGGDINIQLTGTLAPHSYFLLERTDDSTISDRTADQIYTGGLNNNGETLTLLDPANRIIDTANAGNNGWGAGSLVGHCSMERVRTDTVDEPAAWTTNDGLTHNGVDANGNPICGTPGQLNSVSEIGPTRTPTFTPTITPTSTRVPGGLFVNEFMPNPAQDWNGDGSSNDADEWIELYNVNTFAVDLSGWQLDDVVGGGSKPFTIPSGTSIPAFGYLVIYRSISGIALNNSNDDVTLLSPDSAVVNTISYKSSDENASWSRNPDGAMQFTSYCPPTPGAPNCGISPTPTISPTPFAPQVYINEFLPAPYFDWNGDGVLDTGDEWVELFNASYESVDLSEWRLDDAKGGSAPYHIPPGTSIGPRSFLVLFGSETSVGLNNDGDTVRLKHPDDTLADRKAYTALKTNVSYGRLPDGSAAWTANCVPSPGAANCSQQPTPTPTRAYTFTHIADARQLSDGAVVSVQGSVVERPCAHSTYGHDLTIEDETAGIHVYLAYPHTFGCGIRQNERVVVTGVVGDFYGLRTIYPQAETDVERNYGIPHEVAARAVHTGEIGESIESMRVSIQGAVSNGKGGDILWVNDGTGVAEVHVPYAGLTRGSIVRVSGVVTQNNRRRGANEGYALVSSLPDDLVVLELADKPPEAPGKRGGVDLGAISIEQAVRTRTQNYVTVGGTVTVPPGVISDRDFWIQDANGNGVRVFVASSAGEMPALALNENVSVRGRVVSSFGAREVRVELADAIGRYGEGEPVAPRELETGRVTLASEAALVAIQGFVSRFDGRQIYIDDGSGEVLVYIDADTGIRWGRLRRGDPARIIGIVSRFGGEPEILPRFVSDMQFGYALLPVAGASDTSFLLRLRANGRIGEDLKFTRHLRGKAAGTLKRSAVVTHTASAPRFSKTLREHVSMDWADLAALMLLAASSASASVAVKKYRDAQRHRQK